MLINIGNLAQTYHVLPSVVLSEATTFDLMVTDVMMSWENHKKNPSDPSQYQTEDLQRMMENLK